jgi:hypothetical protein
VRPPAAVAAIPLLIAACAPAATPTTSVTSVDASRAPATTPIPDLVVTCDAGGNRPELTCEQLTQLVLAAVAGLPRPASEVGISAYGFPCDAPIPEVAPAEPCGPDVDEGPTAWVAFEGTRTIAALNFESDGADGTSTTIAAIGRTPLSIPLLLEAANPVPSSSPIPSQPPFRADPTLRAESGELVSPAMRGGCGSVFYGEEGIASADCGPSSFDVAIGVPPVPVTPNALLVLVAPDGWRFGTDPALAMRWSVRIVASGDVAGLDEERGTLPEGIGRPGPSGTQRQATLSIAAPTTPGDYLVQYDGGFTRDGWSILARTWYWHVRVR